MTDTLTQQQQKNIYLLISHTDWLGVIWLTNELLSVFLDEITIIFFSFNSRYHRGESGQIIESRLDSGGEEKLDYQYAKSGFTNHSRSKSSTLRRRFLFSSGFLTNISNILQRESRASPELGKSSAMHMATELFIKPSAVIGCFLAVRMIFSVFLSFSLAFQCSPPYMIFSSSSIIVFVNLCRHDKKWHEHQFLHVVTRVIGTGMNEESHRLGWTTEKYSSTKKRTFGNDLYQFQMDSVRERSHGGK